MNDMLSDLERSIINDITQIYSIFVPNDSEKDLLIAMRIPILPKDKKIVDLTGGYNQKLLSEKPYMTPRDIIVAKVKDRITDYYSDIQISNQALEQLSKYGDRAKVFIRQFQKDIESSMENTMKAVTNEVDISIFQRRDARGVILNMRKVLKGREKTLQRLINSSYGQMMRYMILWEYQDKGYTKYIFITKDKNCDTCTALDG